MRVPGPIVTCLLHGASLTALLVGGCTKGEPKPAATPPATVAPAPAKPAGTLPAATMPAAPAAPARVGTVLETMDSGGYTYAKLDLGTEQVWVAAPTTPIAVGAKVGMAGGMLMTDFHSSTLNRTFAQIYFVSALPVEGAVAAPPVAAAPAAPVTPVAPVAGGQTIAAVFAGQAALAGKPITVRAKVVKFSGGIMGRNWLHVQDGTGAAGTNDLTVTTAATHAPVAVGDVVVVRGTLATNRDFGAGYSYAVIVEDATVAAQ